MNNIKKIRIKNFRNLQDASFEIKPLTFLLGPNGSGKSTLFYAIMFLSKNFSDISNRGLYYLMKYNTYDLSNEIKLGSFNDILSKNASIPEIKFEFFVNFLIYNSHNTSSNKIVKVSYCFKKEKKGRSVNKRVDYVFDEYGLESDGTWIWGDEKLYFLNYLFGSTTKDSFNDKYPAKYADFEKNKYYDEKISRYGMPDSFQIISPNMKYENYFGEIIDYGEHDRKLSFYAGKKYKKLWDDLSDNDKNEYYSRFRIFYYAIHFYIDDQVNNFLQLKHIPSTRKQFKGKYLLSDGKFSSDDDSSFYGLLKLMEKEDFIHDKSFSVLQHDSEYIENCSIVKAFMFCVKYDIDPFFMASFNVLRKTLKNTIKNIKKLLSNPESISFNNYIINKNNRYDVEEDIIYYLEYLLRLFSKFKGPEFTEFIEIISKTDFLKKYLLDSEEPEKGDSYYLLYDVFDILDSLTINALSNYWLEKSDFSLAISVNKNEDLAYVISNKFDNVGNYYKDSSINASFESSGFHQLYPIILHLSLLVSNLKRTHRGDEKSDFSTLLIEQPELHLHPSLQSKIVSIFADFLNIINVEWLYENTYDLNLFVETHSEHIIRKLQLMVAKNEIPVGDIAINYLDSVGNNTSVKQLRLAENGDFLDPWPKGFFDEAAELAFELMRAQKNRYN